MEASTLVELLPVVLGVAGAYAHLFSMLREIQASQRRIEYKLANHSHKPDGSIHVPLQNGSGIAAF